MQSTGPQTEGHLPDPDKISVLAATILLAYALSQYVAIPGQQVQLHGFGVTLAFEINVNTVVALLVAGLSASGADWFLRSHPSLSTRYTIQHWVLPGMTALVLGLTLNRLENTLLWWLVFSVGALLLILVLVAEYIVVDANDFRFFIATTGLTALSFALYLVMVIILRVNGLRLVFLLVPIPLAAGLICYRTLILRLVAAKNDLPENRATAIYATTTTLLIVLELLSIFHYWNLTPFAYAFALLGPTYALTSLFGNLASGQTWRAAVVEPITSILILWGFAFGIQF